MCKPPNKMKVFVTTKLFWVCPLNLLGKQHMRAVRKLPLECTVDLCRL